MSILSTKVEVDEILRHLYTLTDYSVAETVSFSVPHLPENIPSKWSLGLVVGASGSGKSSVLREHFGMPVVNQQPHRNIAVASYFETAEEAVEKLNAAGLSSVPAWTKPLHALSNGERFRAELAMNLKDGAVIDEFTSVVDRTVAFGCSRSVGKYIRRVGLQNIVMASCHKDIAPWLDPDWTWDLDTGLVYPRGYLQRESLSLEIIPCNRSIWTLFRKHHYLSGDLNKSAKTFLAVLDNLPVGFGSYLTMPTGYVRNAVREHRLVVLPDYQGLGIGIRLSEFIGKYAISQGKRYYARTTHPKLGEYRNASKRWRATSKNRKLRTDVKVNGQYNSYVTDTTRVAYSHEFLGDD